MHLVQRMAMLGSTIPVWAAIFLVVTMVSPSKAVDLTEDQKKLQAEVEQGLMAPCCWNMTLDHHKTSEIARKMSEDISVMIASGKSKEEIFAFYSSPDQFGERILSTPSQKNLLGKMVYWLIPIAFLLGGIVVYSSVRRLTQKTGRQAKPQQQGKRPAAKKSTGGADDSYWNELLEKELKQMD